MFKNYPSSNIFLLVMLRHKTVHGEASSTTWTEKDSLGEKRGLQTEHCTGCLAWWDYLNANSTFWCWLFAQIGTNNKIDYHLQILQIDLKQLRLKNNIKKKPFFIG